MAEATGGSEVLHKHPRSFFMPCAGVPGNCGKQSWAVLKARHIAAVNPCFVIVLTCPQRLWNRLWVTWVYLAESLLLRGFQAVGCFLIRGFFATGRRFCQPVYRDRYMTGICPLRLWISLCVNTGKTSAGGAIAGVEPCACWFVGQRAYIPVGLGQAKNFLNAAQSLVWRGLGLFQLPPKTVDGTVDKVRAHGCGPCSIWLSCGWLFFVQSGPVLSPRPRVAVAAWAVSGHSAG